MPAWEMYFGRIAFTILLLLAIVLRYFIKGYVFYSGMIPLLKDYPLLKEKNEYIVVNYLPNSKTGYVVKHYKLQQQQEATMKKILPDTLKKN